MVTRRYDSVEIGSKVQRTPAGVMKIPATLTRSGVFPYVQPDGSIRREYRSKEEVFAAMALDTLSGATVVMHHPFAQGGYVTPDNWRGLAVGHVENPHPAADAVHVEGTVFVADSEAIASIEAGELTEISLGFDQVYVPGPGVTKDGQPFDGRQTLLTYNHVALVKRGRAGRTVGLRLDSDDNQISEDIPSMKITIAGKEYEAGSKEANAALADLEGRAARHDSNESELAILRKARSQNIRTAAKRHGVSFRADADDQTVMMDTITKLAPGLDVSGQSPDFISGAFQAVLAMMMAEMTEDAAEGKNAPAKPPADPNAPPPAPGSEGERAPRADVMDARLSGAREKPRRLDSVDEIPPDERARLKMINDGRTRKAHTAA